VALEKASLGFQLVGPELGMNNPYPSDVQFSRSAFFSASYGPFRRFTGGDNALSKLGTTNPEVARHLSLFGEATALTEAVTWLQTLKFKKLVCQAAEVGSVFRLPRPGVDPGEHQGEMLSGVALQRLLYGNVLDAYSTGAFGDGARSESGQEKPEELAALNVQEMTGSLVNRRGNAVFDAVERSLDQIARGIRRCAFCEDSMADEVEHFRPKDLYPQRVFRWPNYLV
jgi:hypothetical protein